MIELKDLPARMARLPRDHRGYPVPRFVSWIDGKPDFRVADARHFRDCVRNGRCWLCGQALGQFKAFVIGPMCAVNRVSSEPPSHRDCAEFAVKNCPFLVQPARRRDDRNLPPEGVKPAGIMIEHNPGVALLWITRSYKLFRAGEGLLIRIGPVVEASWWARGRLATREEVLAAFDKGLPALREMAKLDGPKAEVEMERSLAAAMPLIPDPQARAATPEGA